MKPKVSILMCVYNGKEYIRESIESIICQTFNDFEFLTINDGSTDNTEEIILKYSDNDKRINLINNTTNLGISKSLNRGLEIAQGEYIIRMDADDISLPDRIKKQIEFMDKNPDIGFSGSSVEAFGAHSNIWSYPVKSELIKIELLFRSCFAHPSIIFRRELFKKYNLTYDSDYPSAQDYRLWVQAIQYFKASNIDEVLLKYRCHESQITQDPSVKQQNETEHIIINQLTNLGIKPTDEEINIHLASAYKDFKKEPDLVFKLEKWFCKLIEANEARNIYNKRLFRKVLAYKWYNICKGLVKENPSKKMLKSFYQSPLSESINIGKKTGFLIKYLSGIKGVYGK